MTPGACAAVSTIFVDALRRPERFEDFLAACEADAGGRLGRAGTPYPQATLLRAARSAAAAIDVSTILARGLTGEALGDAIRQERARAIATVKAASGA